MYTLEQTLVDAFVLSLESSELSPWGSVRVSTEFNYQRGRTDIVALTQDGFVIAFEAKLQKWREALHQAYRNTCYSHLSYIIVPEKVAFNAIRYESEFIRRSVGLCYLSQGKIIIPLQAHTLKPLQNWLCQRAISFIDQRHNDAVCQTYSCREKDLRRQKP